MLSACNSFITLQLDNYGGESDNERLPTELSLSEGKGVGFARKMLNYIIYYLLSIKIFTLKL